MSNFSQRSTPEREVDKEIVEPLRDQLSPAEGAIAMIAPYQPEQISPTRSRFAEIALTEELKMEDAILALKTEGVTDLHLMINSMGGGVSSSFKIAQALRRNFDSIKVYVPHMAVSGGTLIALVGDEILMGEMSNLSPIDPQVTKNGKLFSVNSLPRMFDMLEQFFSDTAARDAPYPWKALADQIDPIEFQEHIDSASMMVNHARTILQSNDNLDEDEVEEIIQKLTSGYPTHEYAITFPEAEDIFGEMLTHSSGSNLMMIMHRWLQAYVADGSGDHHVRYCVGKSEGDGDADGNDDNDDVAQEATDTED